MAEHEAFIDEVRGGWGGPVGLEARATSKAHDPRFRETWARYLRLGASPSAVVALSMMNAEIDVRAVLPTIRVPTLVFGPGFTPRIAVGCAGNAWIPASVYNIITSVIDGGMSAQQAIEAPRLLIGNDGPTGRSRVQIEDRIPRSILADLEARGHAFTKVGRKGEVKYGYAAVAVVNAAKATVQGGAEPRRSHGTAAAEK